MALNLIVLSILGAAASALAFFVGRATDHAPAGRFAGVAIWLLIAVALAIDLVTSERRARARGVHPRRGGHLVAMSLTAFVAVLVWLITNR